MIKFKPVTSLPYILTEEKSHVLVIFGSLKKYTKHDTYGAYTSIPEYDINYSDLMLDLLANPQIRTLLLIDCDEETKLIIDNIFDQKYKKEGNEYVLNDFPKIKLSGKIQLVHLHQTTTYVNVFHDSYKSTLTLMPYNKEPIIYND